MHATGLAACAVRRRLSREAGATGSRGRSARTGTGQRGTRLLLRHVQRLSQENTTRHCFMVGLSHSQRFVLSICLPNHDVRAQDCGLRYQLDHQTNGLHRYQRDGGSRRRVLTGARFGSRGANTSFHARPPQQHRRAAGVQDAVPAWAIALGSLLVARLSGRH